MFKVPSHCLEDDQFKKEELESVGGSQTVLKCLYLARIGRLDILWSVNKLARSVTKWIRACDRRLARLISYIQHRQYCRVGNTAQHCRLGLFQYFDFAGDFEDSKSTYGGVKFSYIFEFNEAVIKVIIKGRNPMMRHVSRTHRVALDR